VVEVWLPYESSEIPARVPAERLVDILSPKRSPSIPDVSSESKRLMESNESLQEMIRQAQQVCIAVGECGRKQLATELAKGLVQSLVKNGKAGVSITVLCTPDSSPLDSDSLPEAHIISHDPASSPTAPLEGFKGDFVPQLNSIFLDAELKIVIGELKPHNFLQYAGLCDLVMPGLASEDSLRNQISNRTGISMLDIHKERVEVANAVRNLVAIGIVLDADMAPACMTIGAMSESLENLEDDAKRVFSKEVVKPADIVVMSAGGMPVDQSLLRAIETFPAGLAALKRDGALIVAAECGTGHGDQEFYAWASERKEPRHLEARLRHHFNYNGFKAAFLLRAVETHRIYLASTIPDHYVENVFGMKAAKSVNAALQTAQRTLGSDSTISVIPDASRIVPLQAQPTP
jgi:nickel-dependent lactate racemase